MSFKNLKINGAYNQILSLNETIIQKYCEDVFRFYHTWRISKKISNSNQEDNTGTTDISVSVKKQSWIAKRLWGTPNIDRCILHIKKNQNHIDENQIDENHTTGLEIMNVGHWPTVTSFCTKTKLLTFVHNDQQSIIKRNVIKICSL